MYDVCANMMGRETFMSIVLSSTLGRRTGE